MSDAEKLLPCPFCGGEAEKVKKWRSKGRSLFKSKVYCF